jgi:chemotaxis protein MotB
MARALGLGLLPMAIFSGCATQDALTEQTDPIKAHVATLDEGLRQAAGATKQTQADLAAARDREQSLARKLEALTDEARQLRAGLADQAQRASLAEGRAGEVGAKVNTLQAALDGLVGELAALGRDAARRMDGLAARQASMERQISGLEARLEDLAARGEDSAKTLQRIAARQAEAQADANTATGRFNEELGKQAAALDALRGQLARTDDQGMQSRQALETRLAKLDDRLAGLQAEQATRAEQSARGDARLDALARRLDGVAEDGAALRLTLQAQTGDLPARLARLEGRMDDLQRLARSAMEMAAQMDIRSNGKVAFSVVLTDDKTLYPLNLQQLASRDQATLDALVQRLKTLDKDYHLEIQGHTDNTSVDDYNYQLGKARAEVVKRYLHEQGGIPLGWMSVISYGATQPLDPKGNNNRRIVIHTLVLEKEK